MLILGRHLIHKARADTILVYNWSLGKIGVCLRVKRWEDALGVTAGVTGYTVLKSEDLLTG